MPAIANFSVVPLGKCAVLAAGLFAASCAAPEAPAAGQRKGSAPTIVSLNPCLDAILVEIAEPSQILALSHYSRDAASSSIEPEIAGQFAFTGGTAEEVFALQPDIVLASNFIAPATRSALERLGLRVETFGSPATLSESSDQVRRLAQLTGRAEEGEVLIRSMSTAAPPQSDGNVSAVIWQPGQITAGEATLISEHLNWAGFTSYSAEQGLGQADYISLETMLADPPDVIFVAGQERGQSHPLLKNLQGTLVTEFDTSLLFCGGPTIPKARAKLIEAREQFESEYWRGAFPS